MGAVVCHEQEQGAYDAHDGALRQPVGAEHFLEMLQLRAGGKHGAHIAVLLLDRIAERQNPAPAMPRLQHLADRQAPVGENVLEELAIARPDCGSGSGRVADMLPSIECDVAIDARQLGADLHEQCVVSGRVGGIGRDRVRESRHQAFA